MAPRFLGRAVTLRVAQDELIKGNEVVHLERMLIEYKNPFADKFKDVFMPLFETTAQIPFRSVNVTLLGQDLHTAVREILQNCDLPISYLDSLPVKSPAIEKNIHKTQWEGEQSWYSVYSRYAEKGQAFSAEDAIKEEKRLSGTLIAWLRKNSSMAHDRLSRVQPIRVEAKILQEILCKELSLRDIVWQCGWNTTHFRGCLESLGALWQQHPTPLQNLRGRTVVFGSATGVSLDGHVILSSQDVRNSWLDLIKNVNLHDRTIRRIPAVKKTVSQVLRDIQVDHRKFQPIVMAQNYESQLRALSAALTDYWVKNGYPDSWPSSLQPFQLVVECEAGPLMLSPTGQFIVPAACPAFLIVSFITEELSSACKLLAQYRSHKLQEEELHAQCFSQFGLTDLQKDDNITPDLMATCCKRLLDSRSLLEPHLRGARLFITHFYSVLQDGEVCIPWNWRE